MKPNTKPLIAFVPSSSDGRGGDCLLPWELFKSREFQAQCRAIALVTDTPEYRELAAAIGEACRFVYYPKPVDRVPGLVSRAGRFLQRRIWRSSLRPDYWRSLTALRRSKPDLVWFNLGGTLVPSMNGLIEAVHRDGIPYWYVANNVSNELIFPEVFRQTMTKLICGATRVVAHSNEGLRLIHRAALATELPTHLLMTSRPAQYMEAAAHLSKTNPPSIESTARFLHVGSYVPEWKGQHMLLSALSGSQWRDRAWKLTLAGNSHSEYLRGLCRHLNLESRVQFVGFRDDVLELHRDSDVFLFPSITEGKGLALIEGMAAGRPALGTPIGGIKEVIRDGVTGWLADAASTESVAKCLERVWHDRSQWPRMGAAAADDMSNLYCHTQNFPGLVHKLRVDMNRLEPTPCTISSGSNSPEGIESLGN